MDNELNRELKTEYLTLLPLLQRLSDELTRQLQFLLLENKIQLGVPTQTRIKTFESIIEKHSSKRFNIKKSILELQDLVGIRIILLFRNDIDQVLDCISKNFKVLKVYNAEDRLENNQFGYSSKHLIIALNSDWIKVPTFKDLAPFSAEIQVRSLAQHIWAESSTFLQYKNEQNVPKALIRSISRVSALLETVDLEYERLLELRKGYIQNIDFKEDQDLNVDTLKQLLDKFYPIANRTENEPYSELLMESLALNLNSIPELQTIISKHLDAVLEEDKRIVSSILEGIRTDRTKVHYEIEEDRLEKGVFYIHAGLLRGTFQKEFGKKWDSIYKQLREKRIKNAS